MDLLTPARSASGRRIYGPSEMTRIALVILGKDTGMSLGQIADLLAHATDRQERGALYRRHREILIQRIAAAQTSLAVIDHAAQCEADDLTECPDLHKKLDAHMP